MTLALEQTARHLFEQELRHRRGLRPDHEQNFGLTLQASPVSWLLPRLLRMVLENTDRPLNQLKPMIHHMLREQAFTNTGGDCVDCEQLDASITQTVEILMVTLDQVRREALEQPALHE